MKALSVAFLPLFCVLVVGFSSVPATASSRSTQNKSGAKLQKKAPKPSGKTSAVSPRSNTAAAQSGAVEAKAAIPAEPLVRKGLEAEIAPAIVYGQYGGQEGNRLFRKHSQTIIKQISDKITADRQAARLEGKAGNPSDLKTLLQMIGKQRNWLAGKTKTEDQADFGKWRAGSESIIETSVDALKYPLLDSMLREAARASVARLVEVPWLNSTGWIGYSHSRVKAGAYQALRDFQMEMAELVLEGETIDKTPEKASQFEIEKKESRITAKILNIHLTAPCLDPKGMKENRKDFKGVEFGLLYIQNELKFGDLYYPVTGAYTCLPYRKGEIDLELFEKYLNRSFLFLVHTSGEHMDTLLEILAPLWQQAIHWDAGAESQDELKRRVGELHYRLSHLMPYFRGSAAGLEWLTSGIYLSYGLSPSLRNWNSVEQAILGTFDLERFLTEYVEQVQLVPVEK